MLHRTRKRKCFQGLYAIIWALGGGLSVLMISVHTYIYIYICQTGFSFDLTNMVVVMD